MKEYILEGKKVVECTEGEWAEWFENANRHVADTFIQKVDHITNAPYASGDPDKVRVSTVFLGIDHSFTDTDGDPLIFETMIFGGEHNDRQHRCYTWAQAEVMHMNACKLVIFDE